MKSTCPTRNLIMIHVGLVQGCVGSARLFGYQHVGIGNAEWSRWGLTQRKLFCVLVEYRLNCDDMNNISMANDIPVKIN